MAVFILKSKKIQQFWVNFQNTDYQDTPVKF